MVKRPCAYLRSAAFELHERRSLEAIPAGCAPSEVYHPMQERGFEWFWVEGRGMGTACGLSAAKTLAGAACLPKDVDVVVFARSDDRWSPAEEAELLTTLSKLGINDRPIYGLSLQSCSGASSALRLAADMVAAAAGSVRVLVILFGRADAPEARINLQTGSVFSDGAASCLVTSEPVGLGILAAVSRTNTALACVDWGGPGFAQATRSAFRLLKATLEEVYFASGAVPADIDLIVGTNGSEIHLEMLAEAAGAPSTKLYMNNLRRFGHAYSADNLIGLATSLEEGAVREGEKVLLIGWSPHIASAAILHATAYPTA